MKKIVLTMLLAGLVSLPLAAQDKQPQADLKAPAAEQGHKAFEKAHKEHRAKMKAAQEKMAKLVKEYNGLKDGKKKDAKRSEIEKEVGAIHEEQLKFKADQLVKFEARLEKMKANYAQENSADGRQAWVNQKTDALIAHEGDLRVLFDPKDGPKGPRMDKNGPGKGGPKGKMHGHKGPMGPRPDGEGPHD